MRVELDRFYVISGKIEELAYQLYSGIKAERSAAIIMHLLRKAYYKDTVIKGVTYKRGQLLTTRRYISDIFCTTNRLTSALLNDFSRVGLLHYQASHLGYVITFLNYNDLTSLKNDTRSTLGATTAPPSVLPDVPPPHHQGDDIYTSYTTSTSNTSEEEEKNEGEKSSSQNSENENLEKPKSDSSPKPEKPDRPENPTSGKPQPVESPDIPTETKPPDKPQAKPKAEVKKKAPPSHEGQEFALWFQDLEEPMKPPGKSTLDAWATEYDKMVRIDKLTDGQIKTACMNAKSDEFWCDKFHTPKMLRKKYVKQDIQYVEFFFKLKNKSPVGNGQKENNIKKILDNQKPQTYGKQHGFNGSATRSGNQSSRSYTSHEDFIRREKERQLEAQENGGVFN
ncbi:MAG: hypothetical protein Kapaf2KO_23720 [Candidatus Kapaibacteriales bacterium]